MLSAEALAEFVELVAAEVERRQPTAKATGRWLSIAEAADLFGVDHKTLRRAITDARVPAVRIGRSLRVREADVAEHLAYQPRRRPTATTPRRRAQSRGRLSAIARDPAPEGGV